MEKSILKKRATLSMALQLAIGTVPELVSKMRGTHYADGFEDCRYLFEGGIEVDEYRDSFHVHDDAGTNVRIITI